MKSEKITLSTGAEKFLTDKTDRGYSLKESINEWNQKQEQRKYLTEGVVVKVRSTSEDPWNGRKGFVCKILHPVGWGFDKEKSGKFSVCFYDSDPNFKAGDFIGSKLHPTGEMVTKEIVKEYLDKTPVHQELHQELKDTLEICF